MPILKCEISLHTQPPDSARNDRGELELPTNWATAPWGRTFDDALAAISELPGLYTELDGSLAWNSLPGEARWQLFGCLYDRGAELAYVDLFGTCDRDSLARLFACVRGSIAPLMVQDRGRGVFFDESDFLVGQK
ncbi:hypothetical protein [Anatilimnocola floriformis]|uniref:hypothetical protein n=1 Tax=Anatilimnocola floriformis TaxID=2948575 RepID=UPI0020C2A50E|nr:hypothetical protein [Anatilimnocola floriformis]